MPTGVYERKPFTEEHKTNMSKAHIGVELSEEHKINIGKGCEGNQNAKGFKHTKEARRKISKANESYQKEGDVTKVTRCKRARKIYEERHGKIPKGFELHHKDEDRTNNSDENHKLYPSKSEHMRHHALKNGLGTHIRPK